MRQRPCVIDVGADVCGKKIDLLPVASELNSPNSKAPNNGASSDLLNFNISDYLASNSERISMPGTVTKPLSVNRISGITESGKRLKPM